MNFRIGHGYDVHRLQAGRQLILGGVVVPYPQGLLGHSDADVLLHAMMDAMLGGLALGDIGAHFPDNDMRWRGADSMELLKQCAAMVKQKGYQIGNIDATVIAQRPQIAPYIMRMRKRIAAALELEIEQVSIKATTEEGLGFTGSGEGIAAHCVCLLGKN